jgi:hypothetical protein
VTVATDYVRSLQDACRATFGVTPVTGECLGWLEADATVDQAIEWMNHGCGPGDFAGCADKAGAWL